MSAQPDGEKQGTVVADRFSIQVEYHHEKEQQTEASDSKSPAGKGGPDVQVIGQRFQTVLQLLWQYVHNIGAAAEATVATNLAALAAILTEISQRKKMAGQESPLATVTLEFGGKEETSGDQRTIRLSEPIYEYEDLKKITNFNQCHNAALRILNETAIQQIVNSWERLIADLLGWRLLAAPESVAKDRTIAYREILSFKSFDDVKKAVIDREIETFLKGMSADDQIKHFEKEFHADLSSNFPPLGVFKELILRRHAIVHAGGVASGEYIRRASTLRNVDMSDIVEGSLIPLDAGYVKRSWCLTYAAGIILLHLVVRQYAKESKQKDLEEEADKFLNNAAFVAIQNRQYDAAEEILSYANKLHLSTETHQLMARVNLAQTKKWKGHAKDCASILKEYDWKSTSSQFRLCVAALESDFEMFKALLPVVAAEKQIKAAEMYEWPVFAEVRQQSFFDGLVVQVFGVQRPTLLSRLTPKVIDLRPQNTRNALKAYMEKELQSERVVKGALEYPDSLPECSVDGQGNAEETLQTEEALHHQKSTRDTQKGKRKSKNRKHRR